VYEAVEDGVGEGGIADQAVPFVDEQLARDEGGFASMRSSMLFIALPRVDTKTLAKTLIARFCSYSGITTQRGFFARLTSTSGARSMPSATSPPG
jgi:hypothetical protein